ncbi:MAG: hypothetical protein ABIL44_07425 [candidate division WOR-3 bacterium]
MSAQKILAYISGIIAVICIILAVTTRVFLRETGFLGLSALSYLRVTQTMLLFALMFILFDVARK